MKKNLATALLSSAMAVSMLAGCGGSASTTEPAATAAAEGTTEAVQETAYNSSAELTFDWWGGDSRHEATQKAVEAFTAKYGNPVKVNFGAWSDWETARALDYSSKKGSDVTQINFSWIPDYDADGTTFLDLNTVSDVLDLSQYNQKVLDMCKDSKGGLAGIPIALTGRTFYWNKTTYDLAGIDTPKTLDDLMAAGKTFQEKLGDDYYPLSMGQYDRALFMAVYLQANTGTPIIDESGKLTVTEDQLVDAMNFIKSLEDNHVIPTIQTLNGMGNTALNENPAFIDGHLAGMFEWDSAAGKYMKNLAEGQELVVGDELTGLGDKGTGIFSKVSMLFAISANTKNPTEAATLLNFLVNEPEGVELMGTQRGIPESKAAYATLDSANELDSVVKEAHEKVMSADPMYFSPKFDNSALKGDTGAYNTVFEQFSYGQISAEDAAKALYDAYQSVCNQ